MILTQARRDSQTSHLYSRYLPFEDANAIDTKILSTLELQEEKSESLSHEVQLHSLLLLNKVLQPLLPMY